MIEVTVNGAEVRVAAASVAELLATLGYDPPYVAVAINRTCVPRAAFAATLVRPGDAVEILAPMAGG